MKYKTSHIPYSATLDRRIVSVVTMHFSEENYKDKGIIIRMKKRKNIFYGWFVAFAGFLMIGLSVGLQTNCNVAFLQPMSEALGYNISEIALNTSLISLAMIPCYIIVPKVLRRVSYRRYAFFSGIGFLLFKILFALSTSLWQFYLCSVMMGIFIPGISFIMVNSLIDGWFNEKKGLALGIAATGAGVSGAIFLPLITKVIMNYGWRNGYLFQAVLIALLLTVSLLLIRNTPESVGLKPLGADKKEAQVGIKQGFTLQQTLKLPTFYILLIGIFLLSAIGLGIQPYLMSSLTAAGYEVIVASKIVSAILLVSIVGKIVMGSVFDRFGIKYAGVFIGMFFLFSLLLLCVIENHIWIAYSFALIFGITYVSLSIPVPYIIIDFFGSKEFTAIYGVALMVSSIGSAFGSILTGLIYDAKGSYQAAWMVYMLMAVALAVCIQVSYGMVKSAKPVKKIEIEYE